MNTVKVNPRALQPRTAPQNRPQRSLQGAFYRFVEVEPLWADSLFDLHFLTHAAAPLFAAGHLPSPEALAGAYWGQLGGHEEAPAEVRHVAARFLTVLAGGA